MTLARLLLPQQVASQLNGQFAKTKFVSFLLVVNIHSALNGLASDSFRDRPRPCTTFCGERPTPVEPYPFEADFWTRNGAASRRRMEPGQDGTTPIQPGLRT